jgi:adenylate cyclase
MYGELVPFGGGDTIPLNKDKLLIGRRESCDIVLRFGNVSAHHCELILEQGYWFVNDLGSRNGTKVNGLRVTAKKRIDPDDRLSVAKHHYEIHYSPAELGAEGPPPDETVLSDILGQSLMKSAGLDRKERQSRDGRIGRPAVGTPDADHADFDDDDTPLESEVDAADDDDAEAEDATLADEEDKAEE